MRVLMLVDRLKVGGTEMYILSIAKALKALGVQVEVASLGGPLSSHFRSSGVPVHIVKPFKGSVIPSLLSILSRKPYRIIHAHDSRSFRWVAQLHRHKPYLSVILTLHGKYHRSRAFAEAAKHSRKIVAVSQGMLQWAKNRGVSSKKLVLIPNGIDTAHFAPGTGRENLKSDLGVPRHAHLLGYAGRFSGAKGRLAERVMNAAQIVITRRKACFALFAGPGRARARLSRKAAAINKRLGRRAIIVKPSLLNIRRLYQASDVVVGTGRVALEAMSCGRPVIAAGVAGYLGPVTPRTIRRAMQANFGDHSTLRKTEARQLAKDAVSLLGNARQRKQLGRFGRKLVMNHFSIRGIALRLKRLYEQC